MGTISGGGYLSIRDLNAVQKHSSVLGRKGHPPDTKGPIQRALSPKSTTYPKQASKEEKCRSSSK
jgi:hypothetical protein